MVQLTRSKSLVPESLNIRPMASPPQAPERSLQACASTASLFLYAQGSTILCLHHDTLALDRRFENHQEDIAFISVDNVSERGQGRLVVSYDVGHTAIVWDLFTGTEIARFASFEPLRVASWMRNGNVAFGNTKGEVILFEPSTSEHISTRTIAEPITTLAPGADCRTYAIGYQNGSVLLATLHPTFTILHTLTASRSPSPLITLAWHASSSKQKSDMLASQALNGDLKVWSVSKPPEKETPRTIRVLKRSDTAASGPQWMAWSKNGKILQYMNGETWSWDVRTKHVTSERIPAIDGARGIANYGPTATLFTLGPNFAVQQYDLEISTMVANVHHPPMSEDAQILPARTLQDSPEIKEPGFMFDGRRTPSENEQPHADLASPASSRSNASSKASGKYRMPLASPPSRSEQSNTGYSLPSNSERDTPQPSHGYAPSMSTLSTKSSRVGSRLRNEVQFSPADKQIDLFPFIRTRLNDVPYGHHQPLDEINLTPDGLRQRILSMVFGWEGDVKGLIQDELNRHPPGSQNFVLLAQWLGESDTDEMVSMIHSGPVSISDWMTMAFSQMSGQTQANKVGQAFVQKLLETGDIHTAATILLGLGDKNDAIEIYVSQNYYMEAIIMTCLLMPTDWQRQSYLVRRWGENVVSHSQQQLALRCFMCTGVESSEPWTSPAAQNYATFAEGQRSPMSSPEPAYPSPASPPAQRKQTAAQKAPAKTPALKLITSFENPNMRLPGLKSDNQTPTNVPWITPIAESAVGESALSPGGLGNWRTSNMQSLNHAVGARSNTPGFRGRLPSIGETPVDVEPPAFLSPFRRGEYAATSDSEDQQQDQSKEQEEEPSLLLPSARYDPTQETKSTPQTAVPASQDKFANIKGLPSPAPGVFEALRSESRNGSRDRKPDGLQISLFQDQLEKMSNSRSPLSSSNSLHSAKTPSTGGYSIDQFIHSLDEANQYQYSNPHLQQRVNGQTAPSQDARWNEDPYNQPAPLSPPPMSPEEATQEERYRAKHSRSQSRNESKARKPASRNSSKRRHNRSSSRNAAGRTSDRNDRGRSSERDGSGAMSPSSSLPMSPIDDALRLVSGDRERRTHQRSNSRRGEQLPGRRRNQSSDSNMPVRPGSRQAREHESATDQESMTSNTNGMSQEEQGLGNTDTSELETRELPFAIGISEQRRKELAAAELEARRLSLARNPSAPKIPFPGDIRAHTRSPPVGLPFSISPFGPRSQARQRAPSNKESQGNRSSSDSGSSQPGLPASPSAMRAKYNNSASNVHDEPNTADTPILLSGAKYQPDTERIGRSMSVPVPESQSQQINVNMPPNIPTHPRYNPTLPRSRSTSRTRNMGHRRDNSREFGSSGGYFGGSPVAISIEETLANARQKEQQPDIQPPILPELQHLNTPPPPPPPPFSNSASASPRESSGTIDIAFDNENLGRLLPRAMTTGPAYPGGPAPSTMDVRTSVNGSASASPDRRRLSLDQHRRGKSANESFTSKIRNLTRMRSNSRGLEGWGSPAVGTELPYESVQIVDRI